jgi:hypothetical protein
MECFCNRQIRLHRRIFLANLACSEACVRLLRTISLTCTFGLAVS